MLSNPTNLQRHRRHRRQQSTPTAYDAPKVPTLPNLQRHASHRRGMSLDQYQQPPTQAQHRVSITNQGFNDTQQHTLRETQQQRLARQGQQQQIHYFNSTNDENYLTSPIVTPQRQTFDSGCMDVYGSSQKSIPYSPYPDHINSIDRVNPNDCAGSAQFGGNDSLLYPDDGELTPSAYLDFSMDFDGLPGQEDWNATIKPSRPSTGRRVSGNIADRVAMFEVLATDQTSRPITPPNQSYFPLTPAQTPYTRAVKTESTPQRFLDDYDTSLEATIKPASRRNQQAKSNFQQMRDQVEMDVPPSPPGTGPMPSTNTFHGRAKMPKSTFVSMTSLLAESKKPVAYESPYQSPSHSNHSQNSQSQSSSPEISHRQLYCDPLDSKSNLRASNLPPYSEIDEPANYPSSPIRSSSMQRSVSVDSMNVDETIAETGITIDDIACYISGPDLVDQKWLCLFPDCKKRFGRKENIKSHVQTHLGDRQFQCPHCSKCFVRQHDLKRHAKIHSGVKPYPCACGNSFARHDALTRHRQRGMCIGAFEGVVKKNVKRGRPRKNRPDDEERLDKSCRTRSKNDGREAGDFSASDFSSASEAPSSASEYSESSYSMSPRAGYAVLDSQHFSNFTTPDPYSQNNDPFVGNIDPSLDYSLQASVSVRGDCVSPHAVQNAPSPAYSSHSHHSSVASMPTHDRSRMGSVHSPPDLCASFQASSPSASLSFYDMPLQSDGVLQEDADEMFLDAFGNDSLNMVRLEQDTDLLSLIGGKEFGDPFAADVDAMFGTDESWVN